MSTNPTSLPTALFSFAFTGVLGPHVRLTEQGPRVVSTAPRIFLKPAS